MAAPLFRAVCYIFLAVLMLVFMAINRDAVVVRLLPWTSEWTLPLYAVVGSAFLVGLVVGLSFSMVHALQSARLSRRQARAIAELEKELAERASRTM